MAPTTRYSYNPILDDPGFETELIRRSAGGDVDGVLEVLRSPHQLDPDAISLEGKTALMYAAENGHDRICKFLIGVCDVNKQEPLMGRTALMFAAGAGHTRCVKLLVSEGNASVHLTDIFGRTAYDCASGQGHGTNRLMMETLRDGPDPNAHTPQTDRRRWMRHRHADLTNAPRRNLASVDPDASCLAGGARRRIAHVAATGQTTPRSFRPLNGVFATHRI